MSCKLALQPGDSLGAGYDGSLKELVAKHAPRTSRQEGAVSMVPSSVVPRLLSGPGAARGSVRHHVPCEPRLKAVEATGQFCLSPLFH